MSLYERMADGSDAEAEGPVPWPRDPCLDGLLQYAPDISNDAPLLLLVVFDILLQLLHPFRCTHDVLCSRDRIAMSTTL